MFAFSPGAVHPSEPLVGQNAKVGREVKSPMDDSPNMKLCGRFPVIATLNVRWTVDSQSETINLPANDAGQRHHPFYEVGKLMSEAFRHAHCDDARQSHQKLQEDDPWPFKQKSGVRSLSRSRWDILP